VAFVENILGLPIRKKQRPLLAAPPTGSIPQQDATRHEHSVPRIDDLLRLYYARFPAETVRHAVLMGQLSEGDDFFARTNMRGHITTSASVLNPSATKILLVHHRIFRKWLPPGGHYESPGSLWESALREVAEETGVRDVAPHKWMTSNGAIPVDIDTHPIPPNQSKAEGAHLHHDFRFLAVADDTLPVLPQLEEIHEVRWVSIAEMGASPDERVRALHSKLRVLGVFGMPGMCALPSARVHRSEGV